MRRERPGGALPRWAAAASALALGLACGGATPQAATAEQAEGAPAAPAGPRLQAALDAIEAGDWGKAEQVLEQLEAQRPRNAQLKYYRGVVLLGQERPEEAIAFFREALSLSPALLEASLNLTAALLDAGDAEAALQSADEALQQHPGEGNLLYNRALALSLLKREGEALEAYAAASEAAPQSEEVRFAYAEALFAAKQAGEAREQLRELTRSQDAAVLASSARLLGRLEAFDDCIEALDRALDIQPAAELLVLRGLCNHGRKNDGAAVEDYRAAGKLQPDYAPAHYYLGMQLRQLGQREEARRALQRAVELAGGAGVGQAAERALQGL